VSNLYDTSDLSGLLVAVKNYESSLPSSNIYPGDITYFTSLTNSIKELKGLYEAVFRSDSIKHLDENYRNMLSKKYRTLTFAAPDQILSKRGLDSNRIVELEKYSNVRIKNLLQGKAVNKNINDVEIDLQSIIDYFIQVKNYEEADRYYNKLIELYKGLIKANANNNNDLNKKLSDAYTSLAYYSLFDQKPAIAISSSQSALEADSTNLRAYTNMAAGYLLERKFKEAESIYTRYKEKFTVNFLDDIEALTKENIITGKDNELTNEIDKIKRLLNR
jgi:tetratricopeptide (TPR) repeat protein